MNYSFYGLVFDTFSILVSNALFVLLCLIPWNFFFKKWYQQVLKYLFIVTNTVFLMLNCIDCAYFAFTKKRSTLDLFDQIGGQTDVLALLPSFFKDFWYVVVVFIVLLVVIIKTYRNVSETEDRRYSYGLKNSILYTFIFIVCTGLCVLGIRGGFGRMPISPVDAGKYGPTKDAALLFNTPFTIIKSAETSQLQRINYLDEATRQSLCHPIIELKDSLPFTKENIVVIILESFGKEYTKLGKRKSYTPFFDSLMSQSLVYTNAFANAAKSIEGIPAILSGIPSMMENPYVNSPYCTNNLSSFASILKPKGYTTAFFHGGFNGTMNFDAYTKGVGYEFYFGKREYANNEDFDGSWGIWDEPFLQYSIQKMNTFKAPFHSAIFTLSSHHPYRVPDQYKNKFEKGTYENHACIQYTDYALKRFFETAKKTSWYKNTLFVLVADHTSLSGIPFYSNYPGALAIPIVFFRPDNSLKAEDSTMFQQITILPKTLQLTHCNTSLYNLGHEGLSLFYYAGNYFMCDDSLFYEFNGDKMTRSYNYRSDSIGTFSMTPKDPAWQAEKEKKIKAIIQTFNNDLIDNKMGNETSR